MKELTIEEKAKAYDEALEIAKECLKDGTITTIARDYIWEIFPELKESEDEKIRKELITHFRNIRCVTGEEAEKIAKWIAWLEKQGEQKDSYITIAETGNGGINALVTRELPTDGEQEHADKVEPKFHPGDWVIDNIGYIYQIESATEIESEHIFGYTIVGGGYFNDNNDVRLWTIEDAKRGDVLVDVYGNIGIFDKCYDFDWTSYCSLGKYGGFQYFTVEHENEKTYPASKEQRDLFFSKMKEEGWEWDSENKELKKNL